MYYYSTIIITIISVSLLELYYLSTNYFFNNPFYAYLFKEEIKN